jgi:hypothetical protein
VKKHFGRLVLLGALAGGAVAVRGYLHRESAGEEAVQIVFDDGSIQALASNSPEGREFTDMARKLVDIGV